MKEAHRIINNCNQWSRRPDGYYQLGYWDRIQENDVQKLNDEWYCEYKGKPLIGEFAGSSLWFRLEKKQVSQLN